MRRILIACLLLVCARPVLAQEPDMQAVDRAKSFLDSAKPWPFINVCVHFPTEFRGQTYAKMLPLVDRDGVRVPGQFALVYDYQWADDGSTQLAYYCDTRGNIFKVQVLADNGSLNRPFALANASIAIVGDQLYEALKNDLTDNQRRVVRQIIDSANAQRLLEYGLPLIQQSNR